ncbi:MAG: hypothetical protein KC731_22000, partial [Myxococcales bacterium]|nr:hypothetical protein [Myxococcales bacterium]
GADDEAGRASGSGKNQLVQAQLDDAPVARAIPGAGSPGSGGTKPKGSAAQVLLILVRVRVRTRGGRPLANAEVTVDAGATPRVLRTDKAGFAKLTLVEDDFGITMPRTFVTIEVMVRHHGPDPGGNDVKTKRFHASVAVDQRALRPQSEQTLLVPDASTPGIVEDPKGRFLDVVMMDAGMNRRGLAVGIPTRRLTDDQVLDEMIFHYVSGDLPLDAASEPQFDHDPASGDLDPCTDACKLRKPKTTDRVGLLEAVVAGVTFLHFMNTAVSQPKKGDLPGERYTRERISWKRETLNMLDQRQAVGVTRLCHHLRLFHDIAVIYNVGISGDQGRADCHGHGLAIDFSGCAKALPGTVLKSEATTTTDVRMGTDFIVFLHWGRVPMWDPKTVAANPADSSKWVRLPDQFPFDDLTNFETVDPKIKKLHYRLDPAPFQPAPGTTPSELEASIAGHFAEARVLFRRIYQFFVDEYSDGNDVLGPNAPPDVPTELDGHDGHFIIHPDYAEPNASAGAKSGREAHNNHLHAQLGKTNYPAARFP